MTKNSASFCRIADIGCGNGDFSCYLKTVLSIDNDIVGIDFSPESISVAKKLYSKPGISYGVGDVRHIPLKNKSMDITLCINMLHHVYPDDLPKALSELARISKDLLILEIKNKNDIYTKCFKPLTFKEITVYPTSFKKVSKILKKLGFRVINKTYIFLINFISPIQIITFQRAT